MYSVKQKIIYFSLLTRLSVYVLQYIANILIPDHDAQVFISPVDPDVNVSVFDNITNHFLGGFIRWDAQYFYHIAAYGYTFENTLAFFPLYPLISRIFAQLLTYVLYININTAVILSLLFLNVIFFIASCIALYNLSSIVLNKKLAYRTAILFCVNPATIFFVAPYTETLFSFLTFYGMFKCYEAFIGKKLKFWTSLLIVASFGLSTCTRSNGILNLVFIIYFAMRFIVKSKLFKVENLRGCVLLIRYTLLTLFMVVFATTPFILTQAYDYYRFCKDFELDLPNFLIEYSSRNLTLPGMVSKYNQTWCFRTIPLAYSYIQEHYWNVGFLKYYQFKQAPNFVLAAPVVVTVLWKSQIFLKQHFSYCMNLGLFRFNFRCCFQSGVNRNPVYNKHMFVFIVHSVVLILFCLLCVHVQVTTRMLCSASPVLYWFVAYVFDDKNSPYETTANLRSPWKVFLFTEEFNAEQRLFKYYFLSYLVVGTVMFCNYLPWT